MSILYVLKSLFLLPDVFRILSEVSSFFGKFLVVTGSGNFIQWGMGMGGGVFDKKMSIKGENKFAFCVVICRTDLYKLVLC